MMKIGQKKMLESDGMRRTLLLTLLLLASSGCITMKLNNTDRLIKHPQFNAAATAAPDWTRNALKTIADLEREIESQ